MSNSYFKFKQFTVHQDQCAMKVSTEACILGAWLQVKSPNRILDIGAGTGLLSLMLAQRFQSTIDAVEIDEKTAEQASDNACNSPWSERIHVFNQDIRDFAIDATVKYDLIVCNPPFFRSGLKSDEPNKNLAKHETASFDKPLLVDALKRLLSENGCAFVIYPKEEAGDFGGEIEKKGLFWSEDLTIRNKPSGPIFRKIIKVSKVRLADQCCDLNIRNGQQYSTEFTALICDYYLNY